MSSEAGKSGSAALIALGIALGAVLVLRVLWSGVTYPESNVAIILILAILLAASLYISALTGGIPWRVTRTGAFVLLYFLVVLLLSICSGRQWLARDFLFQTAACTAAYLLAENLGSSRPARIALSIGVASGVILVSLYGLHQCFYGLSETRARLSGAMMAGDQSSAFVSRVSSNAIFSTFFYPNALAGYLIIAIPFVASIFFWPRADSLAACYGTYLGVLLAASVAWGFFSDLSARPLLLVCLFAAASTVLSGLAIAERKGSRLLLNLCALPLVILPLWALSLTASEGAWLALLFSVLFTPLLLRGRYRIASAIGLVVLALVVVAVLADMVPAGMKDSAGARVDYWRAAWGMWRENPVRGLGPGGFAGAYARFRAPGSEEGRMPHSIYLGLASEMGAIGLAAFICLWVSCIRSLCAGARRREPVAYAVCISVVAFLVHGAIDVNLSVPETSLTLWALAGLGVGASTAHSRARRLPALSGVLLGFLVLGAAIFWIGPRAGAEWHRLRSQKLETRGMRDRAGEEVLKALSLEGDNPVYWNSLAEIMERAGNVGGALAAYRQAAVRGEGIPAYHFRLAACYWRHAGGGSDRGKAAAAMDELRKAIACNPHDVDYHLLLAYWLETTGRPAEALGEYRHGLGLIHVAREKPKRIRRHSPAEYERLDAMVRERVAELDRAIAGRG